MNLLTQKSRSDLPLRAWLTRHRRHHQPSDREPAPPPELNSGLVQFYVATSGATHSNSWNETETLPDNPFQGLVAPQVVAASGSYPAGYQVRSLLLPYRESEGSRVYAGLILEFELWIDSDGSGVHWPAWSEHPGWFTGFSVVRQLNGSLAGYRDIPAETLFGGWMDTNGGWSADMDLPCDYVHPPTVAKVVWHMIDQFAPPETMSVVSSPLGGVAFNSSFGSTLVRLLSDDVRRNLDGTMAYWFCPTEPTGYGVLSSLRGVFTGKFPGNYFYYPPSFSFGDFLEVDVPDHQEGDWYLMVLRNDVFGDRFSTDLLRLRDGAQFSGTCAMSSSVSALSAADDYLTEGIWSLVVWGSSWHWGVPGYAYYDRLGLWNRALSDDEVLVLFNCGLGWEPS